MGAFFDTFRLRQTSPSTSSNSSSSVVIPCAVFTSPLAMPSTLALSAWANASPMTRKPDRRAATPTRHIATFSMTSNRTGRMRFASSNLAVLVTHVASSSEVRAYLRLCLSPIQTHSSFRVMPNITRTASPAIMGGVSLAYNYQGKRIFIKDMAYYFMAPDGAPTSIAPSLGDHPEPTNPTNVPLDILRKFNFTFLIRHPRRSVPSYWRCTIPPLCD